MPVHLRRLEAPEVGVTDCEFVTSFRSALLRQCCILQVQTKLTILCTSHHPYIACMHLTFCSIVLQ